ncbi:NAD(P) transhydrogenase subunit alpha [Miltoncostaea marina]|uniref:NAD(P) transhydrogenase subunit alpha n=1 Tax=Miltoncostaea marina TaxID=2843215 RepID=UPI001C3E3501|nr:NAD(P) transhydrogenase subunit alpha [Miltoncostaea marina]
MPAETLDGERRVALTPAVVPQLQKLGAAVVVESGAGAAAGYPDAAYEEKGATIGTRDDALSANVVAYVRVLANDPASPDLAKLHAGQVVVGMAAPFAQPRVAAALADKGVTLHSLELLPRTTRAQAMDVLSSQANIAGFKSVLMAGVALPKVFPLMTTAAGTMAPARVFVVGAGVAGLSAIATARRLGAVVEAYDVRAAAKEEVKSLGAKFVEFDLDTGQEGTGSGAYAKALTDEQLAKQRELMTAVVAKSDVVITTAQVQGAKAPVLITDDMVRAMAPGSVVVDLAAEQGGNVEPSRPGETVDVDGVKVIGPVNVPSEAPFHASQLYGKNVANFLALIVADGAVAPPGDDDIVNQTTVCRDGRIVNERVQSALGAEEGVTS